MKNSSSNKPIISSLRDLGSLSFHKPSHDNRDKLTSSDGRYSPGEKVQIRGQNLLNTRLRFNQQHIDTISQTDKKITIKLPVNMTPFSKNTITVNNQFGQDSISFNSSHYLIGSDTDGNRLHFIRSNPDEKGGFDPGILELEHTRSLFNLVSDDRSFVFSIGVDAKTKSDHASTEQKQLRPLVYTLLLKSIHLNQADKPKSINEFTVKLQSTPISAEIDAKGRLIILGKNDLVLLDVSNPFEPKILSKQLLPLSFSEHDATFVDAVFFNNSRQIALLEAYTNQVFLYDLGPENQLRHASTYSIFKDKRLPLSVDLEIDSNDPEKLWVLLGANFRELGKKIYSEMSDTDSNINEELVEEVIALSLQDNKLVKSQSIKLPDNFVPFYIDYSSEGEFYVSGVNGSFFDSEEVDGWENQLKSFASMLISSVKPGRVLLLEPESQSVKTIVEGVGIYYDVTFIPGKGPAFCLLKLTGSIWAPFVKVAWGMGIQGRGTYSLRDLSMKALFPPYSIGQVNFQ